MLTCIRLYYQDFKLNAGIFNENGLIFDPSKAALIAKFSLVQLRVKLKNFNIELAESASMIDICDALFQAYNQYSNDFVRAFGNRFKSIGHTSISIGDYVTFEIDDDGEEEVLIYAPAGWKGIGPLKQFIIERNIVVKRLFSLPAATLRAMWSRACEDNGSAEKLFERYLDIFRYQRCENRCPKCHSDDIEWSTKDIQDSMVFQNATCNKCECEFTEEYHYTKTVIDEKVDAESK